MDAGPLQSLDTAGPVLLRPDCSLLPGPSGVELKLNVLVLHPHWERALLWRPRTAFCPSPPGPTCSTTTHEPSQSAGTRKTAASFPVSPPPKTPAAGGSTPSPHSLQPLPPQQLCPQLMSLGASRLSLAQQS